LICIYCEAELDAEEMEDPYRDEDGNPMCYECHISEHCYRCCLCDEHEELEHQGAIGTVLVVVEAMAGEGEMVSPGMYEIIEHPFYTDAMISGWLHNDALRRIGDVPADADCGQYPSGCACRECSEKLNNAAAVLQEMVGKEGQEETS